MGLVIGGKGDGWDRERRDVVGLDELHRTLNDGSASRWRGVVFMGFCPRRKGD